LKDGLDVSLEDVELMTEVQLMVTLIVAASESDTRLTTAQVDRYLGVPAPAAPGPFSTSGRARRDAHRPAGRPVPRQKPTSGR
jgi:hypothetical protein